MSYNSNNIPDAPWVGNPDYGKYTINDEEDVVIGTCYYCDELLYKHPRFESEDWTDTPEHGLVCRYCFGTAYFSELKDKADDY